MTTLTACSSFLSVRLPLAWIIALIVHLSVFLGITFTSKNDFVLPVPLSGFEMVELPSPSVFSETITATPIVTELREEITSTADVILETERVKEESVEPEVETVFVPVARVRPLVLQKPQRPRSKKMNQVSLPQSALKDKSVLHEENGEISVAVPTYIPPNANASYLRNPKPLYPRIARKRGLEGTALLSVAVTSMGAVSAVSLKKSSGHVSLDNAAIETVKKWKFQPARKGKDTVSAVVEVPIRFQLNAE